MKILHVIPSAVVAGVEIFTSRLAGAQAKEHEVSILTPSGPIVERYADAGVAVHLVEAAEHAGAGAVAAALKSARPQIGPVDIVHVHSAAEHCRAARRWFPEAGIVFRCSGNVGLGFWLAGRAINWWADIGVANSTSDYNAFRRAGVAASKLRLIHNGAPPLVPSRDGPASLTASLGLDPDRHTIVVTLARLARAKGLDVLIRAAGELKSSHPELRFVLAGTGPDREKLEALVARLGLCDRIVLPGLVDAQADLLALADIYAHPARHEPFPNAVLEAMSMGLPVVASRVGGIVDQVVEGETGLLVAPDDPSGLAGALQRLADDPETRRKMGAASQARQRSEYSLDAMVAKFLAVYDETPPRRRAA